jgi:hypothetical protein
MNDVSQDYATVSGMSTRLVASVAGPLATVVDLVGARQQSRRDIDTKRTRSLQVEDEFEFG